MIRQPTDDRGVSIALTHVLTIAITTVLVAGLLLGASGLLEDRKTGAAQTELRTLGNRMAEDIANVDHEADGASGEIVLQTNHPTQVSGSGYAVSLYGTSATECGTYESNSNVACLVMGSPQADVQIIVPFRATTPISESSVSGGDFFIVYDGSTISISGQRSPALAPPSVPKVSEVRV
jgi:FlaG/FlaF family flagellin (archaellin)